VPGLLETRAAGRGFLPRLPAVDAVAERWRAVSVVWLGKMTRFQKIPTWADRKHVYAVVETPRGGRAKLKYDTKLKAFTLAKPLMVGLAYPYDWGFVPATKAEDGDPVDALIIHDAATYPGLVLTCRPIGVLEIVQISKKGRERNDRVFLIPAQPTSRRTFRTCDICRSE
jgi:hypothetical protein